MKVVFRADASSHIGIGHIVRCATLGRELRRRGADVVFVCRTHPGHQIALLEQQGFTVAVLSGAGLQPPRSEDYAAWRGVSEEQDAAETLTAIGAPADWLVADHYGLGPVWENKVRRGAARIAAIDDLDRAHDADLVIDQNLSEKADRYPGLPAGAKRLLGPTYALLSEDYRADRRAMVRGQVARILVFFGGADPQGVTVAAFEALSGPAFAGIHLDVVVGAASPHRPALADLVARRPRSALHAGVPSLRDLVAAADLAVGGGGVAMLERCCMGLPQIVTTIANNQVPGTRALAAQNCIVYLGAADAGVARLAEAAATLVADRARREAMSACGRLLVDGWGAARVAEQMAPTAPGGLALRPAEASDSRFYYTLVNDPEVRRNSFHTAPIPWDQHQAWFAGKRAAPGSRLWVLTASGLAVGQVRLDRREGHAYIDYSLDPLVRGRGWGAAIISLGLRAFFEDPAFRGDDISVRAEVKSGNLASRAIFEKLGFRVISPEQRQSTEQPRQDEMMTFEIDRILFAAGPAAGRSA